MIGYHYGMREPLFRFEDWFLQQDTVGGHNQQIQVASIRHDVNNCGKTSWFNDKQELTHCKCGSKIPDEIQSVCVLFNMEWLQNK